MSDSFDLGELLYDATTRWLDPLEIAHILLNHEKFQYVLEELQQPHGGTLFLYNCHENSSYETDGYWWCYTRIKPIDILKVVHETSIRRRGNNSGLLRRRYSMWDDEYEHIVLVHYRGVLEWMKHLAPDYEPKASHHHDVPEQWIKGQYLGRGFSGLVYRGFNRKNGEFCAIKEVKMIHYIQKSQDEAKQLKQEIDILTELKHPNIVQYYGSNLTEDKLSIYLEYVPYGSIDSLLDEFGPLEEPLIRDYTAKILCGLTYLHDKKTVHRAIKGQNILVSTNGEVKLADFGTAKHISSSWDIHCVGGTNWMAPEVLKFKGYSSPVDIWSLACTVIEMATAQIPWYPLEEGQVWNYIREGTKDAIPEIPDNLSNEGKDFLEECLKLDPASRSTAAKLMEHPFITNRPAL